jgi:heptosyltransferase-1
MTYKNILIVKLSAIGDVVHALPVAHALKECYPQAKITWVVERPAYDLLTNNSDIDEILVFDKPKFKSLSGLVQHGPGFIRALRRKKFDLALDLQGLMKSGMIAAFSGAKTRFVYENAREGSHLLAERIIGEHVREHVVERYLDVVRHLGCRAETPVFPIRITEGEAALTEKIMAQAGLRSDSPFVVLALGANWPNKIWPYEHYAVLCDKLYADGIVPVVTGGNGDRPLADSLRERTQIPPVDLIGKTTLKQLAYILKKAKGFIGGDTGPMHLAAALGTPLVALMGPTDAVRNGPYHKSGRVLVTPRECAGCWQRRCPQNLDCLQVITPEAVYDAMQEITGGNNEH